MQSNSLNVSQISNILSIASLISAICIFISSLKIQLNKIKNFISITLILKIIVMFLLFISNKCVNIEIIKGFIILDIVLEKFIILSIYPLIICIKKNDNLYSKRKLVEYLCRDIGILIGGIFIEKTILSLTYEYWIGIKNANANK